MWENFVPPLNSIISSQLNWQIFQSLYCNSKGAKSVLVKCVILICLHNETVQINIIVRFFLRHARNLEAKYADLTALFFNFTGYITQISLKWIITITNGNTYRTWLPIMLVDHIMLIMCKVCSLLLSVPFEVLCL